MTYSVQERWNELTAPNEATPWNRVLPEKLTGPQLVKKLPAFYGTRSFITASTFVRTRPYSEPEQSRLWPHLTSWIYILILSSHLNLGLPSRLFPLGLPTKSLYSPLISPYVPHASPISFLIWSLEWYLVRSTKYVAPRHELTTSDAKCYGMSAEQRWRNHSSNRNTDNLGK